MSEVKLNWDTTVKYSAGYRLQDASAVLVSNPGLDDGDRNFRKGLISNRLDVLSEMDLRYQRVGLRVSAAGWYDSVYNRGNANDSFGALGGPFATTNHSGAANEFPDGTRRLHGRKTEFLDAFAFAGFDVGDMRASVRLGKHTVLYGESFFLGANGIAAAQAPIDIVKALSVPGTQFKELMRPVPQASGTLQITDTVSLGAYYQFRWEANRIPGAGSYFSFADNVGDGSERLLPAAITQGGSTQRQGDLKAKNAGQGGMQLRLRLGEADVGLYAVRWHAKDFQQYTYNNFFGAPGDTPTGYQLVYPQGIKAYGASVSQSFGDVNFAAEASTRRNTPLVSQVALFPNVPPGPPLAASGDNSGNPAYAVGNSAHLQASILWQIPKNPLFSEGAMAAEVAWNRALSVTKNPQAVDPNTTRDAWALRMVTTPVYRQVFDGTDLEVPIGLGWNPKGRSRVVSLFNAPAVEHGGDLSIGLNAIYLDSWRFGLNYTHYFGSEGTFVEGQGAATRLSFKQVYGDRDFISLTARTTF